MSSAFVVHVNTEDSEFAQCPVRWSIAIDEAGDLDLRNTSRPLLPTPMRSDKDRVILALASEVHMLRQALAEVSPL